MTRLMKNLAITAAALFLAVPLFIGCSGSKGKAPVTVTPGEVDCKTIAGLDDNCNPITQEPGKSGVFEGTTLGVPISSKSMGAIDPDPTGYTVTNDYDGDGIPNDHEVTTNPYVADYPKIVARVTTPVTMEIRIDETSISENHSETIEEDGTRQTIENSMEDSQYAKVNDKTTPYVSKEDQKDVYGYHNEDEFNISVTASGKGMWGLAEGSSTYSYGEKQIRAENFDKSYMTEKTVFEDVNYIDNMDSSGVSFTDDTVKTITSNARKSEVLKNIENIGPNNGFVRTSFFLKNKSVNIPVHVSNVVCTLTFRTASGSFLPVKTFTLRNEDYTEFSQDVYGSEELGPFVIELNNLNTHEVRSALMNGYLPQIHVVSYDITRVQDSNYNPGVNNLKIVEETAKGRTAYIKISAQNIREDYRVAAFDIDENGSFVPGISLKKALFNILRDRIGEGEKWTEDKDGNALIVPDEYLKWRSTAPDKTAHTFVDGRTENNWRRFSTYIKTWTDEYNKTHKLETIKRIELVQKYNPFNSADNPSYDPRELLSNNEISKMKYWIILHNGQYFEGDINDPIWAGDRYEIICFDVDDFSNYQKSYIFSPLQSQEKLYTSTYWNSLNNSEEFDRSIYLGQIFQNEVIHLEVDLLESRKLLPDGVTDSWNSQVNNYTNSSFNNAYMFAEENVVAEGIPSEFTHTASGGTNSINLVIDQGEPVSDYLITLKKGELEKTITISSQEVETLGGNINISRRTRQNWTTGDEIGFLEGGDYIVNVRANNVLHGVNVYKNSLSNTNCIAAVSDVADGVFPGSFTYRVTESTNSIKVAISQGVNTEYYVVQLIGPQNYTFDENGVRYICYAGNNTIELPNPSGEVFDSGVYEINVYPINNNYIIDNNDQLQGSYDVYSQYISVPFERFEAQKLFKAAEETDLKKFDAIDLEVNFNDGSGWYRLQLATNDSGSKKIDCRFSSYYEYDKQKFHIFFKAPNGANGDDVLSASPWDVFGGGRNEVGLYVRTVADKEYRDRFWMKDQVLFDNASLNNSITSVENLNLSFLDFWLNLDESDTTNLEKFTQGDTPEEFTLSSTDMNDYFFSPLEYRVYSIRAKHAGDMYTVSAKLDDLPKCSAEAKERGILINNVESITLDGYKIFWREAPNDLDTEGVINLIKNENIFTGYEWNSTRILKSEEILADDNGDNVPDGFLIDSLVPNQNYVIALVGYNRNGYASDIWYYNSGDDRSKPFDNLVLVTPYTTTQAPAPQGIHLTATASGGLSISNIIVPGYRDFEIQWKREGEEWGSIEVQSPSFDPYNYTIEDVKSWNNVYVQVRAFGIDPEADPEDNRINGLWSETFVVPSTVSGFLEQPGISWIKTSTNVARLRLNLSGYELPEGCTHMKITGTLSAVRRYTFNQGGPSSSTTVTETPYTKSINLDWFETPDGTAPSTVYLSNSLTTRETWSGNSQGYDSSSSTLFYYTSSYRFIVRVRNSNGEEITTNEFYVDLGAAPY